MRFSVASLAKLVKSSHNSFFLFFITCLAILVLANFGPAEQSLGTHIHIIYLHGAWVWASMGAFLFSAIFGALGLLTRKSSHHAWSKAFGRTGLFFWITYLPLSLWAMQANWNGLFLLEPRWRLALIFAITGSLLQIGLTLANQPNLTSASNLGYFILLVFAILQTENIMHPVSPILKSDSIHIQGFFLGLVLLISFAAWQIARWWYRLEPHHAQR